MGRPFCSDQNRPLKSASRETREVRLVVDPHFPSHWRIIFAGRRAHPMISGRKKGREFWQASLNLHEFYFFMDFALWILMVDI